MKKITYIFTILLLLGFNSCDNTDFGDLNENPNGSTEPYYAGLMTAAMMQYNTLSGRSYFNSPTLYVQWQTQVTYTSEMRYSVVDSPWSQYYVNVMNELTEIINDSQTEVAETQDFIAQGSPENQRAVALIFRAMVMKRVTDTWGPAPFSEAFQGVDNISPKYDTQEEIYNALIAQIKEGRDLLDTSASGPKGDIIYNGDVSKWHKLANSVLMQMALQISDAHSGASGVFTEALASGPIENIGDEAWASYADVAGQRSPIYNGIRYRDYFLSREFTDALKGNQGSQSLNPTSNSTLDARIALYSNDASADGKPYGFRSTPDGTAQISDEHFWTPDAGIPMMTASYTYLNRAEAAAKGWTSESAEDLLKMGIAMSYQTLDAHKGTSISDDADDYADARLSDANANGLEQVIAEEKWVALFPAGFDAWAEFRRTGYPMLQPAADALNGGVIPTRYIYPSSESNLNGTNYSEGVSQLTPSEDSNTSRVWWDVN